MEQKNNKFIDLIRENRVLVVIGLVMLAISVLLFWLGSRPNPMDTGGDLPAKDSGAFLIYDNNVFHPFSADLVDNFIMDDIAYFARQNIKDKYDPDKNPLVAVEVKEYEPVKDNKMSFKGKFDKVKGDVMVSAERLAYDRVKVSITWNDINIDAQLPSASKRNKFILTLPLEKKSYSIVYSPTSDSFRVVHKTLDGNPMDDAKALLKSELGDEYSEEDVGIEIPGYLKNSVGGQNGVPEKETGGWDEH